MARATTEIDHELIVKVRRAMERASAVLNTFNWKRQRARFGIIVLAFRLPPAGGRLSDDGLAVAYAANIPVELAVAAMGMAAEQGEEAIAREARGFDA